ncbi:hypothetical protein VTK73DRAFT_4708 [Phialemonium thermophilum]|uniref:Uncharacterized protein n=1 Tax=Phialemonium thermophilum TaxID=223376 RepID=A0ABR3V6J9_9PEZI
MTPTGDPSVQDLTSSEEVPTIGRYGSFTFSPKPDEFVPFESLADLPTPDYLTGSSEQPRHRDLAYTSPVYVPLPPGYHSGTERTTELIHEGM